MNPTKSLLEIYGNNKGADQHANLPSPISYFLVRCLNKIQNFQPLLKSYKPSSKSFVIRQLLEAGENLSVFFVVYASDPLKKCKNCQ